MSTDIARKPKDEEQEAEGMAESSPAEGESEVRPEVKTEAKKSASAEEFELFKLNPRDIPLLESTSFEKAVEWAASVENLLSKYAVPTKYSILPFVPAFIIKYLQKKSGKAVPKDFPSFKNLLFECLRPAHSALKMRTLRTVKMPHLSLPTQPGQLIQSLLAYDEAFGHMVEALAADDSNLIPAYAEGLQFPFKKLAEETKKFAPDTTLQQLQAELLSVAGNLEQAYEVSRPSVQAVQSSFQPRNERFHTRSPKQQGYPPKLDEKERARCLAENRCLRCRQIGHRAAQCKKFGMSSSTFPKPQAEHPAVPAAASAAAPSATQSFRKPGSSCRS